MAQTLKSDELNILRDYFSVMELPQEEIDKRVALAGDLFLMHKAFILLVSATEKTNGAHDIDYYKDYLKRNYEDCLTDNGIDTDDYIDYYIDMIEDSIIETTQKKAEIKKAIERAENDANAIANYEYEQEMIAKGYTRKRWVTMRDNHVRATHIVADGQERDIKTPFDVGTSQLMFPNDTSLGADACEIINCRCSVIYLDKTINAKENESAKKQTTISYNLQFFAKNSKDFKSIKLSEEEYAHVVSEINTNLTDEQRSMEIVSKAVGNYIYTFENNGFDNYRFIRKKKIDRKTNDLFFKNRAKT